MTAAHSLRPRQLLPQPGAPGGAFRVTAVASLIAVHVALGFGGALSRHVATAQAVLTVVVSVFVWFWSTRPDRIIAVTVYGGLCDVYWRMAHSSAPWELSKYLLATGAIVLLVRFVRSWAGAVLPAAMLLVLVPGMVNAAMTDGIGTARDNISSYEMAFIALAFAAMAFRHVVGTKADAWNLAWIALGPLIAVLSATTYFVVTTPDIEFGSESNFAVTGGYGPNQVSSILGLIMLICVLIAFLPMARRYWPLLACLSLWSLWATFLTFSRGGIYSLALAGGAMLLVGVSSRGARTRSLLLAGAAALAIIAVFGSANDFTGNALDTRYEDKGTASRTNIAEMDLDVWAEHPLTGVGSGRAPEYRPHEFRSEAAAHTEFTRVVAEHGVLGLVALTLLAAILVQAYRRGLGYWNRLMVVALSMWALTTMLHAATRVGAVAVMLALTQLRVEDATHGPSRSRPSPSRDPDRSGTRSGRPDPLPSG